MELNNYLRDYNLLENGTWIDVGDDSSLLIASMDSDNFRQCLNDMMNHYGKEQLENDPEKDAEVLGEALAQTVLLDWKNLTLNGKPVEYSVEAATQILNNPRLKDFRIFVITKAQNIANFRGESLEALTEK